MNQLPMDILGPREMTPGTIHFGLLLPGISSDENYGVSLRIIHEHDQFLQGIQPEEVALGHSVLPGYGDFWSVELKITPEDRVIPSSAWGQTGRYVYRFCLTYPNPDKPETDWIIDPFAREFGIGKLSAFTMGYRDHPWDKGEETWKTPSLSDLVVYEMMISEFAGTIENTLKRLDYLADLGITCLEIMPVSNCLETINWGFSPVGYFGVDERFGNRKNFQQLVNEAHNRGMAVILDSVYAHTDFCFPYLYLYNSIGTIPYPMTGPFAEDKYGNSTDFNKSLTRDFFYTVNLFWLEKFHIDGFRYDYVPGYYLGPDKEGYASLVSHTYKAVEAHRDTPGHWQRFFDGDKCNLIQCAEHLDDPCGILEQTYSTCTWQNKTLDAATSVVRGDWNQLRWLGFCLGLQGFCEKSTVNGDCLDKSAFQYVETHDNPRFITRIKIRNPNENVVIQEGDRELWYRLQPYLIALFTAKGIPFLWQGQEFGENYYLPEGGYERVKLFRPMRWDYFYTEPGKKLVSLVRKLTTIRRDAIQFRKGAYYFYDHHDHYQSQGVLLFSRNYGKRFSLVALNFGNAERTVPFWFPTSGSYVEELWGNENLTGVVAGEQTNLVIPGNYGRIWTLESQDA